jgi:hypothetical protein
MASAPPPLLLPLIALRDCMSGTEESSALLALTVSSWVMGPGDWDPDAGNEEVSCSGIEEEEDEEEDDEEEEEKEEDEEEEGFMIFCNWVVQLSSPLLSSPNPVRQFTLLWNVTKEQRSFGLPIS